MIMKSNNILLVCGLVGGLVLGACGGSDSTTDAMPADAPITTGVVEFSWTVSEEGSSVECSRLGNSPVVTVEAFPKNGGPAVLEIVPCESKKGSIELESGTWRVDVELKLVNGKLSEKSESQKT